MLNRSSVYHNMDFVIFAVGLREWSFAAIFFVILTSTFEPCRERVARLSP